MHFTSDRPSDNAHPRTVAAYKSKQAQLPSCISLQLRFLHTRSRPSKLETPMRPAAFQWVSNGIPPAKLFLRAVWSCALFCASTPSTCLRPFCTPAQSPVGAAPPTNPFAPPAERSKWFPSSLSRWHNKRGYQQRTCSSTLSWPKFSLPHRFHTLLGCPLVSLLATI